MDDEERELQRLDSRGFREQERTSQDALTPTEDGSEVESQMPSDVVDAELDRRTIRKLDFVLLPFLAVLFLFNSLDKSNIGNAETAGFTADIGIEKNDLNVAVAVFFVFFVGFQPLGAALGRRFGMSVWVPGCMAIWGICTAMHVWVRSKGQLIVLRMVIGALEAGFYPVTVSYLSLFYTKFEFGRRIAIFYGQSAVAGAFGGILAYFIFSWFPSDTTEVARPGAWRSWQVLFFVEGSCTVVIALVGFLWLPHSAKTAWFLKPDERMWAETRIRIDNSKSARDTQHSAAPNGDSEDQRHGEMESEGLLGRNDPRLRAHGASNKGAITNDRGLDRQDVVSAFLDWKVWYLLVCNILSAIPVSAFSVFLPLVLQPLTAPMMKEKDLPNTALTNLLTAPPFILGAVVLYLFTSYSDRHRSRLLPILVGLGILLVGLTFTTLLPEAWVVPRYLSLCVLLSGSFIASPLQVAWLSNNIPQPGKRSIVLGINGWGNLAGVLSALLFQPMYGPRYQTPFFVTLALVGVAWVGYSYFRHWIIMENKRRDHEGVKSGGSRKGDSALRDLCRRFRAEWAWKLIEDTRDKEVADEEAIDFRYGI